MTTSPAPTSQPETLSLADRAILLMIEKSKWVNSRRIGSDIVETAADKSLLSTSKRLLCQPKGLHKIEAIDRKASAIVATYCVPSPFRGGMSLVPYGLVDRVHAELTTVAAEREQAVEAFVASLQDEKEKAKGRLAELYRESDYPAPEALRAAFAFGWRFVNFGVPDALQQINAEIFAQEREKQAQKLGQATDDIRQALRQSLAEMIEKMVERLTPDEDGKPKMLLKSYGDNLRQFLDLFNLRNVTDDAELEALVGRARELVSGVDVERLRKDVDLRAPLAQAFAQVSEQLDGMIVDKPKGYRQIRLDDEADQ